MGGGKNSSVDTPSVAQCSVPIKCIGQGLPEKDPQDAHRERERIYSKKSVHVIMEAGKSGDLQGTKLETQRADSV